MESVVSTTLTERLPETGSEHVPRWYQDAVVYQLHIRSFCDSNHDGIGDLPGLTSKLDYIQSLGVTAIWLLPFFPSPLKDDGYDIADYTSINPVYGSLPDFQNLLREAHRRELRVITELVMNHTSDQHPWFQRSRRSEPGSKWRDFYVWSDTSERYREARIIFQDFEGSNWTWDPLTRAYYWHRFYHHQPDLNFDNPDVREAMFRVIDFWLEMGVDGMRLDAVPYLYEREGTNCENLPETHAFLKSLRRHVDETFQDRMLLAEANQWPEDAAAYFGDDDECHMNFHFPLMPRLFVAVEREDRFPVVDILEQTPEIPPGCQWGIFLRNHDELTLEMVTDEERDYMYRAYARDPQARLNLGIRRRLAPLLQNNRRKIELMNGLLLSLPGTPIIYYGDEIGMGDNIYLGDRDGVRTPMQWSPDRNAGFSLANPQRLCLPVIIDSAYHFATVNVEVQQDSPHSLLWSMRRLVHLRNQFRALGCGSFRVLTPENSKILAYLRQYGDETLLVVANLSRFSQAVELDLSEFRGQTPVELAGQTVFPPIGELPYFLTLGPHAFFWLQLKWQPEEAIGLLPEHLPVCHLDGDRRELFSGKCKSTLESALLPFLRRDRWFPGIKSRLREAELLDALPVEPDAAESTHWLLLITLKYVEGGPEHYLLPVVFADAQQAKDILGDHPGAGVLTIRQVGGSPEHTLCDANWEPGFWRALLRAIRRGTATRGRVGRLAAAYTQAYDPARCCRAPDDTAEGSASEAADVEPTEVSVWVHDRRNPLAVLDERCELKVFRQVSPATSPDLEIRRYLTERTDSSLVPSVYAALEYRRADVDSMTLAMLSSHHPNQGDAWSYTLDELGRCVDRVHESRHEMDGSPDAPPSPQLVALAGQEPPQIANDLFGGYLLHMNQLGQHMAQLHLALAAATDPARLTPEPFNELYQRSLYQSVRSSVRQAMSSLHRCRSGLSDDLQDDVQRVLGSESALLNRAREKLSGRKIGGQRVRGHASLHLRHVLLTGRELLITDFEGELGRPSTGRSIKASPLRDLAGLIRSLHYAGHALLLGHVPGMVASLEDGDAERFVRFWYAWSAAALLRSYLETARNAPMLPKQTGDISALLEMYLLERACVELQEELDLRSEWVRSSLESILMLANVESEKR
jgi:maltose alpha-D-glucosyltransferase/alpha-amylase